LEERQSTGPQQGRAGILFFQAPSPPDLGILSLGCRVPGNLKLPHGTSVQVAGVIEKW